MSKCGHCNERIGLFTPTVSFDGKLHCSDCGEALIKQRNAEKLAAHQTEADREEEFKQRVDTVILTTETAPNLNITKRIEIVTAECAFGMNIFKDLFAGVRDIVGGRSKAVQETMRDARKAALYELKVEAFEVGANAVVGVDLDYVELSSGSNMVMLVASGTAVVFDGQG